MVDFQLGQPFSGKICIFIFSSSLKNSLLIQPYCPQICPVLITVIKRFFEFNHMICNQIDFQSKDQCVQWIYSIRNIGFHIWVIDREKLHIANILLNFNL